MNQNQKILDRYGELLMKMVRDEVIERMHDEIGKNSYQNFKDLSSNYKENIKKFAIETVDLTLHYFVWMIEQKYDEFDIVYYDKNKKPASLLDISDGLYTEPCGEDGWIERFSKYPPSVT
ncbi:MAG: hypothetical protein ACRC4G_02025 [Alphaproteobacteria bacterium]